MISSLFLQIVAYASLLTYIVFSTVRVVRYANMPVHLRWELYPVAHENGHPSGGSYFENLDWWTKPIHKSLMGELKFMGSEIFFFTQYYRRKRSYWYFVYPFHIGLFLLIGWLVLLPIGVLTSLAGISVFAISASVWGSTVYYLTLVVGVAGFVIASFGCIGLIIKRSMDKDLRLYTTPIDYFKLSFVLAILLSGLTAWGFFDLAFAAAREFMKGLITFTPAAQMNPVTYANILLICLFLVYMPFTSMMHYIAKYFTYHRVRWDDQPILKRRDAEKKLKELLNQPVSWSAPHIQSKKTWGNIAQGPQEDGTEKAE